MCARVGGEPRVLVPLTVLGLDEAHLKALGAGVGSGLVAMALGFGATSVFNSRAIASPLRIGGCLLAGAFLIALPATESVPAGLMAGILLLALAGWAVDTKPNWGVATVPLSTPGAGFVAWRAGLGGPDWVHWLVFAGIIGGGALVADFDQHHATTGLTLILMALSCAAVFSTIPDTEVALVLLGVAIAVAFLGWPRPVAAFGTAGALAAMGAFMWTVAQGGVARGSSIIGGTACLGLLVVEPVARWISRGRSPLDPPNGKLLLWWAVPVGLAQTIVVLIAARVAGLLASTAVAALVVGAEGVVAVVAVATLAQRSSVPVRSA